MRIIRRHIRQIPFLGNSRLFQSIALLSLLTALNYYYNYYYYYYNHINNFSLGSLLRSQSTYGKSDIEIPEYFDFDSEDSEFLSTQTESRLYYRPKNRGWNETFCNRWSTGTRSISKVRSRWRKSSSKMTTSTTTNGSSSSSSSKSRRHRTNRTDRDHIMLIVDLSDWGGYPFKLDRIQEKLISMFMRIMQGRLKRSQLDYSSCQRFPMEEWEQWMCLEWEFSRGLCDRQMRLPCESFAAILSSHNNHDYYLLDGGTGTVDGTGGGKCRLTSNPYALQQADGVILHAYGWSSIASKLVASSKNANRQEHNPYDRIINWQRLMHPNIRQRRRQRWAVTAAGESSLYYPLSESHQFLSQFDWSWGNDRRFYRQHIPAYLPSHERHLFSWPAVPFHRKRNDRMAIYLTSHCDAPNGRDRFVRELSRFIEIDSFGLCVPMLRSQPLRTKAELHAARDQFGLTEGGSASGNGNDWQLRKYQLISQYKFVLALENSDCFDYVSEKVVDAWRVGSIPVYMGAPNIDDYSPSPPDLPPALINVANYGGSVERLAKHLTEIAADERQYQSYLQWRSTSAQSGAANFRRSGLWREMMLQRRRTPREDFCEFLHSE